MGGAGRCAEFAFGVALECHPRTPDNGTRTRRLKEARCASKGMPGAAARRSGQIDFDSPCPGGPSTHLTGGNGQCRDGGVLGPAIGGRRRGGGRCERRTPSGPLLGPLLTTKAPKACICRHYLLAGTPPPGRYCPPRGNADPPGGLSLRLSISSASTSLAVGGRRESDRHCGRTPNAHGARCAAMLGHRRVRMGDCRV